MLACDHSNPVAQTRDLHSYFLRGNLEERTGGAVPSSLKKASRERGRARVDFLRECRLSVGVSQACGALRSKAVSDMKSLVTAFYSNPPRGIEPLNVMRGIFPPMCKTRRRIKVPGRVSMWPHCRRKSTTTRLLNSVTSPFPSPSLLREEKWESMLP